MALSARAGNGIHVYCTGTAASEPCEAQYALARALDRVMMTAQSVKLRPNDRRTAAALGRNDLLALDGKLLERGSS